MESLCTQHNMKCGLAGSWSSQLRLVECSKALAAFSIHLQVIKSFTLLNRASMYIWGFDLLIIGDQLYVGQQCIHLWSLGFWPSHSWGSAWSSWPPRPRHSCIRWGPLHQLPASKDLNVNIPAFLAKMESDGCIKCFDKTVLCECDEWCRGILRQLS